MSLLWISFEQQEEAQKVEISSVNIKMKKRKKKKKDNHFSNYNLLCNSCWFYRV